jgi:hypothetical protein
MPAVLRQKRKFELYKGGDVGGGEGERERVKEFCS